MLPFQINGPPEIQQNQLIMLPPELEQNINIQTEATSPVTLESIDPNLQMKISNMNRFFNSADTNDLPITQMPAPDFLNVEDHVIPSFIRKSVSSSILSDVVLTNAEKDKCDAEVAEVEVEVATCNMCKMQFKNKNDLKVHQCLNLLSIEIDESNVVRSDANEENPIITTDEINALDVSIGKDKNLTEKEFLDYVTKKVQSAVSSRIDF